MLKLHMNSVSLLHPYDKVIKHSQKLIRSLLFNLDWKDVLRVLQFCCQIFNRRATSSFEREYSLTWFDLQNRVRERLILVLNR